MKKMIVIVAVLLTVNGYAQKVKEAEVPKAVVESFNKNFPGAKAEKWEKEEGRYEAEFDWKKTEASADFSDDGKLLETEQEIKTSALPTSINEYIAKNYAGYKITDASKITEASGNVKYEAEVEKGKEEFDLIFDSTGSFIEKAEEKKEDKDKD